MANTNPYLYAGYRWDGAIGMYYLNSRYYAPNLMRFISKDPVSGLNAYTYADDNPIMKVDPSGEMPQWLLATLFVASIVLDVVDDGTTLGVTVDFGMALFRNAAIAEKAATVVRAVARVGGAVASTTRGTGHSDGEASAATKGTGETSQWKPGTQVTEQDVRNAMKNAPLKTQQKAVSLPAVNRYAQRLADGETPPPIKVDNGIIVDGNHRYIAGRVAGIEIPQTPYAGGRPGSVVDWQNVFIDPFDWGNK